MELHILGAATRKARPPNVDATTTNLSKNSQVAYLNTEHCCHCTVCDRTLSFYDTTRSHVAIAIPHVQRLWLRSTILRFRYDDIASRSERLIGFGALLGHKGLHYSRWTCPPPWSCHCCCGVVSVVC